MTRRAEAIRAMWEKHIPITAAVMGLRDAWRYLNRPSEGGREIISMRTLHRRAEDGELVTIGGEGTPLRSISVTRQALLDFACSLSERQDREEKERRTTRPKKRKRSSRKPKPRGRPRRVVAEQATFLSELDP